MDAQSTSKLVANLRKCINGSVPEMEAVFASFDPAGSGLLPAKTFQAGCAALGVVLSPSEWTWVQRAATDASGMISWRQFCAALSS